MAEQWRVVPRHHDHIVSNAGRVRHRRVNAPILRGYVDDDGYRRVRLDGRQERVHRLVCETFHGTPPEGTEVCHIDGDRLNNAADNLRWGTRSENTLDQIRHGTFSNPVRRGEAHHSAKLTAELAAEYRRRHADGESGRALAREAGITSANMSKMLRGERWTGLPQGCAPTTPGEAP